MEPQRPSGAAAAAPVVIVALDHAAYGAVDLVPTGDALQRLAAELQAADGLLLRPDDAAILPAGYDLVLRADECDLYVGGSQPWATSVRDDALASATALGAAELAVNLFAVGGRPEVLDEGMHRVAAVVEAAHREGLSVMVEALDLGEPSRGLPGDTSTAAVIAMAQVAVRCGADRVKLDLSPSFEEVVRAAGSVPVLVRGGAAREQDTFLADCVAAVRRGAAGIVVGRNLIQAPEPAAFLQRLRRACRGEPDVMRTW